MVTVEEKELLAKAARLMEELTETVEAAEDEELVQEMEAALKWVREGRTRLINELLKESDLQSEVQVWRLQYWVWEF